MDINVEQQNALTLRVLRKTDGAIVEICARASFVSVYTFDSATSQWEKCEVEGAMFVVRRSSAPLHRMIVLNRVTLDNLVEDIESGFKIKDEDPFLMYRNSTGEIIGLWFHDAVERNRMYSELLRAVNAPSPAAPAAAPEAGKPHPLLQLLHDSPKHTAPDHGSTVSPLLHSAAPVSHGIPPMPQGNGSPMPAPLLQSPPHVAGATKEQVRAALIMLANNDEALEVLVTAVNKAR